MELNFNTLTALQGESFKEKRMQFPTFKDFVRSCLDESGLTSKRAFQIDIDSYFKLLLCFNKAGIHFVNVSNIDENEDVDMRWEDINDDDNEEQ